MALTAPSSNLPDMNPANAAVLVGAYLVSGLLFSPDLDTRSTAYRRWRWIRWLWLPYQRMVPHRSWVSHHMLFGPVLRILYLTGISAVVTLAGFGVLNMLVPVDPSGLLLSIARTAWQWIGSHPFTTAYAMLGFILGGTTHTLADLLFTAIKRRF